MRSEAWARGVGTGLGVVGGFVLGYAMVRQSAIVAPGSGVIISLTTLEGLIFTYLGVPYVMGGWRKVDFQLRTTPLPDLVTGIFGLIMGLLVAVLIGFFVRDFPYGVPLSAVLACLLGFMGANVGLTRRAELLSLAGLGRNDPPAQRRIRGALLDTSVIIDGRILDLAHTGFLDMPLIVPRFVLRELQQVADSSDAMRRNRGRRGLEVLTQLQKEPDLSIEFRDDDPAAEAEVDSKLIRVARKTGLAILTNDFNLNRIARLEGVTVLNLNELTNALKPIAIPGEELAVAVVKEGKEAGQGVGYLEDGTMVVVENGRRYLNQTVAATVTSVLQTAAGRMIFASATAPNGAAGAQRPRRERV
ncbi:MAG: PIN domain nuclease [Candidatus Dormibacteraeota bacterium]|nr:PIN domain nuclease [Candidatus Dormibacteraeota bacterium]